MNGTKVRANFLAFFEKHKHTRIISSSIVPANDTSVLFTTAGMQQFKPYFLNNKALALKDLNSNLFTSSQKCFRVSDIEEVGDNSHLTFFEMLGNFSVGGYFKKEAIAFAWEFITEKLQLDSNQIWVTYFSGDKELGLVEDLETKKLWLDIGVPKERIIPRGMKDNFWGPPGNTGPCGPSTEIYYPYPNKRPTSFNENELLEIWNIVLMEFEMNSKGHYIELEQKNIDTGMGLERMTLITENAPTVFDTTLFSEIIKVIKHDPQFGYDSSDERRVRIAADHLRATFFLLSDGVAFGKKEQPAIVRRIFRKACDQYRERQINFENLFSVIEKQYADEYPELRKKRKYILQSIEEEYIMYKQVRERKVEEYLKKIRHNQIIESQTELLEGPSKRELSADETFSLFATHGFTLEHLKDEGYIFDEKKVLKKIEEHKAKSKEGSEKKFGGHGLDTVHDSGMPEKEKEQITKLHTATHLLHATLRKILGKDVEQQGSDINPERLRFDFTFERKLTDEEKNKVEILINEVISSNYTVIKEEMSFNDAQKKGALAFFREKYPKNVSVYSIINPKTKEIFSMELCGGPHSLNTNKLGVFAIKSEKSVAKGIRRIKAVLT